VNAAIEEHRAAGRTFEAGGTGSFVREEGDGDAVVLMHGVPTSSFLYRKLIPMLAERGLRAVAFDLPGLGLAKRPEDYDYSWSGLARFTGDAIDALGIERCHLVVHDIGGPVGFEWAIRHPESVLSLTALDTLGQIADFRRPWSMQPFSIRGLGEVWLRSLNRWAFSELFYLQGIRDRSATPREELFAHYELLRRGDGGRAFLKIMRGFELTQEKQRFIWEGLHERSYPTQVIWGRYDRALGPRQMRLVCDLLGVDEPTLLPAKHFLQEDQAPAISDSIASLTGV
jgi:haloalkane dehalogenase